MTSAWRKSSYSGSQANCVEAANADDAVRVRDSGDRLGSALTVSADAWRCFTREIKRLDWLSARSAARLSAP